MIDRLTLDAPRFDRAGTMLASVRAARTGIQEYAGYEVGRPELARVRVFRPESEVFCADSLRSFAGVPVTIDHPPEIVTTDNWKQFAVGQTDTEVVRDGEAVRVPFMLRDAAAIKAVKAGKREISMGYACDLTFEPGQFNGQDYDAIQRNIHVNHLAIVDKARGGPTLSIGDEETGALIIDGVAIDLSDAAAVRDAITGLQACIETLTADATIRDAELTTLRQQTGAARISQQQLRDAARAYALTAEQAHALGVTVTDTMDEAAIKAAAVTARLGDAALGWNEAQIAASFGTLAAQVGNARVNALDAAIGGAPAMLHDAATLRARARQDYINGLSGQEKEAA